MTQFLNVGNSICAGRYVAENTIWLAIASILHAFSVSPAKDENGKEIPVNVDFTSGLITYVSVYVTATAKSRRF